MTKLIPVNGQVLVEIPKSEDGVYIPTSLSDSTQEGVVIQAADDSGIRHYLEKGVRVRWERFAETDGSFDYTEPNGVKTKTVKAVLIPSNKITAFWGNN